ncbi:hypothetical protein DFH06DRAFT_1421923 [Mycena polygramma]|nr:hypothetical protein DFH06DRAFT_1421923 [Mycena polygramma]
MSSSESSNKAGGRWSSQSRNNAGGQSRTRITPSQFTSGEAHLSQSSNNTVVQMSSQSSNAGGQNQYRDGNSGTPRSACKFCLTRNWSCDGLRPQCTNCRKRGDPCTYKDAAAQY